MDLDKSFVNGSIPLLVMKLLEEKDLYGYQMIEEIRLQSADALHLKAGTLYPLLHGMKEKGCKWKIQTLLSSDRSGTRCTAGEGSVLEDLRQGSWTSAEIWRSR